MKNILLSVAIVLIIVTSVSGQYDAWYRRITPLQVSDFEHTSNNDLRRLGKAIGNHRVVMLGEQDHGDAGSMEFKTRLVKYLREQKGFDVLLFESDFYACNFSFGNVTDSVQNYIQPFWSKSKVMQPFWHYVARERTLHPMDINGFLMGFTIPATRERALLEWKRIVDANKLSFHHAKHYGFMASTFEKLLQGNGKDVTAEDRVLFYQNCDSLSRQLARVTNASALDRQFLYNVKAKAENVWLRNYRAKHNAANLAWLLQNRYASRKVIVWTANLHSIKDYAALIDFDSTRKANYARVIDRDSVHTMAHTLREKFNLSFYSLACVSTSGSYTPRAWEGLDNSAEKIVIPKDNVEGFISHQNMPLAFLDLTSAKPAPFRMIPFLHRTTFLADYTRVFDGVVFIGNQKPLL